MKRIQTQKMMSLRVPATLRQQFKTYCRKRGTSVTENLIKYMLRCVGYALKDDLYNMFDELEIDAIIGDENEQNDTENV